MKKAAFVLSIFGLWTMSRLANAQSDVTQRAMASQLFDDAQGLFSIGHISEACSKYAESQRLDPQLGTVLYLGDCYDKLGRTASAWVCFKDAVALAHMRHDDREAPAMARLRELETKLSRLTIEVATGMPVDFELLMDGEPVSRASLGSPIPVDPGRREIRARAAGYKEWTISVEISSSASHAHVAVPRLEHEQPIASTALGASRTSGQPVRPLKNIEVRARSSDRSAQRVLGYVLGGAGAIGVGLGTGFALAMNSKVSERNDANACSAANGCSIEEKSRIDALTSDAKRDALIANVALVAGSTVAIGGLILIIMAPDARSESTSRLELRPFIGKSSTSLCVEGHW